MLVIDDSFTPTAWFTYPGTDAQFHLRFTSSDVIEDIQSKAKDDLDSQRKAYNATLAHMIIDWKNVCIKDASGKIMAKAKGKNETQCNEHGRHALRVRGGRVYHWVRKIVMNPDEFGMDELLDDHAKKSKGSRKVN
jgi:hypothetical protein